MRSSVVTRLGAGGIIFIVVNERIIAFKKIDHDATNITDLIAVSKSLENKIAVI